MARLKYHQRRRIRKDDDSESDNEQEEQGTNSNDNAEESSPVKEMDDDVMPNFGLNENEDNDDVIPNLDGTEANAVSSGNVMPTLPKSNRPKFTIDDLVKAQGLDWIQSELPKMAKFEHKDPAADALRLIQGYRAWHQQLFPHLPFDEFLARVNRLGAQARIRNFLESMREDQRWGRKRCRDNDEELKQDAIDDDHQPSPSEGEDGVAKKTKLLAHNNEDQDETNTLPKSNIPMVDDIVKSKIEANRLAAMEKRRQRLALAAQARAVEADIESAPPHDDVHFFEEDARAVEAD